MAKVCISGYYGHGSADKELMLLSLIDILRRLDETMEIVVFSADPEQTEEDFDVTAVKSDQWDRVKREVKSADLLISGGGELLKETADLSELKYYLKVISAALRGKTEVYIFNQVIPAYEGARAKAMVGRVMKKVRKISVADQNSVEVLHGMGIRRGRIHLAVDPLLALGDVEKEWRLIQTNLLEPAAEEPAAEEPAAKPTPAELAERDLEAIENEKITIEVETSPAAAEPIDYEGKEVEIEIRVVPEGAAPTTDTVELASTGEIAMVEPPAQTEEKPAAKPARKTPTRPHDLGVVAPTFWKKPGEKFAAFLFSPKTDLPVSQITAMADYMIDNGYHVVFIPVNYPDDARLGKEILKMMKNEGYEVDGKLTPRSLCTAIDTVDFVFSSDLCPMILAAICRKPLASLCCTRRDIAFISALGLTPTGNLLDYDSEAFIRNFKAAVNDPAAIVASIEENFDDLREKASYTDEQLELIFAQIRRANARSGKSQRSASAGAASSAHFDFTKIIDTIKGFFSKEGKADRVDGNDADGTLYNGEAAEAEETAAAIEAAAEDGAVTEPEDAAAEAADSEETLSEGKEE